MQPTILSVLFAAFATSSLAAPTSQNSALPPTAKLQFSPSGAVSEAMFQGVPRTIVADAIRGGSLWILPEGRSSPISSALTVNTATPDTLVAVGESGPSPFYLTYSITTGILEVRSDIASEFAQIGGVLVPKPWAAEIPGSVWLACQESVAGVTSGWTLYWSQFNLRKGCVPVDIDMLT